MRVYVAIIAAKRPQPMPIVAGWSMDSSFAGSNASAAR